MENRERGWFTPEGTPRYEVKEELAAQGPERAREACPERSDGTRDLERACATPDKDAVYRARDGLAERDVLLTLGGEPLLERASLSGRLEHPAIVTIYDVGRHPDGRVFVAAMDHTIARPLSALLGEMTRDEVLRAVVTVCHAVAHAEERGVLHPRLDLDQVLRFPDGQFRVVGWEEPAGRHDPAVRSVQKLLRRAIVPFGKAPRSLWSIVRHDYEDVGQLALDLQGYIDGGDELQATEVPWHRRALGWARRHPALATLVGGAVTVLLAFDVLAVSYARVMGQQELEARESERETDIDRLASLLERAGGHASKTQEIDQERLGVLRRRRDLYHRIDSLQPSEEEVVLDGELALLSSRRDAEARLARAALDLADGVLEEVGDADQRARGDAWRLAIEKGRLEHLFAIAAFEEEKGLSTRTLKEARATAPVAEALASRDPDAAIASLERAGHLHPRHAYLIAAEELARVLKGHPGWNASLSPLVERLRARGTLRLVGLPRDAVAAILVVRSGEEGGWVLGDPQDLPPGTDRELAMGEYLIRVTRGGQEYAFPVLIERGEAELVDAGLVPESVPDGFVWIPPAVFYRGGEGYGATRYRKDFVEHPFCTGRTEIAWREYSAWTRKALPAGVLDHFPACSMAQQDAQRFCESLDLEGWSGTLPTEAEWELAARGVAGRLFPWGDEYLPGEANTLGYDRMARWTPVGEPETDRSIYGVLGLAGNVAEWTSTPAGGGAVVVKGGWVTDPGSSITAASRSTDPPDLACGSFGFRVCLRPAR
ncbi:MAG: SUMF1/EgtB/PvdO family nonheme iron enzyme [Planctomycetes bacterium]|nr:SUMF1/EgtB/PvdO family nonheme iron enzyme [Planctomycetota bacterium]